MINSMDCAGALRTYRVTLFPALLCSFVLLSSTSAQWEGFEVYYVRPHGSFAEAFRIEGNEFKAFMSSSEGIRCQREGFVHTDVFFHNTAHKMYENLMAICCKNCSEYIRDGKVLVKGLRNLANAPVEDTQSMARFPESCTNLDGYFENHDYDGCIFRIDAHGVFGGSISSYVPFGNEETTMICEKTTNGNSMCRRKLSSTSYEVTCCCFNDGSDCAYSTGYQNSVETSIDRYLATAHTPEQIRNQTGLESALSFYHHNSHGRRKVHCVYGQLAPNPIGQFRAMMSGEPFLIGGVDQIVDRQDIPEPQSTCGLKMTVNPINFDDSIYNITIDMGAFDECENPRREWNIVEPACPLMVAPNDSVSFVRCCRDQDGCNHISKLPVLERLIKNEGNRSDVGFYLKWVKDCGNTAAPFYLLFAHEELFGTCQFYYDIEKQQRLALFDYKPLSWVNWREIDGYRCGRQTLLLRRHEHCSGEINVYEKTDYPIRDILECMYRPDIKPPPSEADMDTALRKAAVEFTYNCLDTDGTNVPLQMMFSGNITKNVASSISACFLVLTARNGYHIRAGAVSDADESIFEFYDEHFISQLLVQGVAVSYNTMTEETILICARADDRCNADLDLIELMIPVMHINSVDSEEVKFMTCSKDKCSHNLGCYCFYDGDNHKEGCISNIRSEDIHLHICQERLIKKGEEMLRGNARLREPASGIVKTEPTDPGYQCSPLEKNNGFYSSVTRSSRARVKSPAEGRRGSGAVEQPKGTPSAVPVRRKSAIRSSGVIASASCVQLRASPESAASDRTTRPARGPRRRSTVRRPFDKKADGETPATPQLTPPIIAVTPIAPTGRSAMPGKVDLQATQCPVQEIEKNTIGSTLYKRPADNGSPLEQTVAKRPRVEQEAISHNDEITAFAKYVEMMMRTMAHGNRNCFVDEVHEKSSTLRSMANSHSAGGIRVGEGWEIVDEEEMTATVVERGDGNLYLAYPRDEMDPDFDSAHSIEVVNGSDGTVTFLLTHVVKVEVPEQPEEGSYNSEVAESEQEQEQQHVESTEKMPTVCDMADSSQELPCNSLHALPTTVVDDNGNPVVLQEMRASRQQLRLRRNRVYGSCLCPECGQSFVNTARLERHLAVHQPFGSFLCPLCGKTYKYEYNLFFHWRHNCRDLGELLSTKERKSMDVNLLRETVETVAQKKIEIGPIDIGQRAIKRMRMEPPTMYTTGQSDKRGATCEICGVYILAAHLPRHASAHIGSEVVLDSRSPCGGYFCDLCGLLFKQQANLHRHWRTSCQEIRSSFPKLSGTAEIDLPIGNLLDMVSNLLKQKAVTAYLNQLDSDEPPSSESVVVMDVDKAQVLERIAEHCTLTTHEMEPTSLEELVFADDYMDSDMLEADDHGETLSLWQSLSTSQHRNIAWQSSQDGPMRCAECLRTFANGGRLERHMAVYHSSTGSHQCSLCGNCFKFDYNLLYHYRRACPYTKSFISLEEREQMEAVDLRKAVRVLAAQEMQLNPVLAPPLPLEKEREGGGGDSAMRRERMKKPISSEMPPPHLMEPVPGIRDGRQCVICAVFFYGKGVLERHMKMAHVSEYEHWMLRQKGGHESGEIRDDALELDLAGGERHIHKKPAPSEDLPPVLIAEEPTSQPDDDQNYQDEEFVSGGLLRSTYQIVDEFGNAIAQANDYEELQIFMRESRLDTTRFKIILLELHQVEKQPQQLLLQPEREHESLPPEDYIVDFQEGTDANLHYSPGPGSQDMFADPDFDGRRGSEEDFGYETGEEEEVYYESVGQIYEKDGTH
ncbi:hypothetical protein QR680_018973 [Steinernema hermaphroditum]|uniref:C2H2-type domain-containing protein n=1 Tax=Steinernema hermaphroditum TaxID=289476 RepID=A0AA39HJL2_9BILA|nr:hypothetical protein QR680_018973 [Steinernema hermaphroditum]